MARKVTSRRRIAEGKKFYVERITLESPGGRSLERELIVHPGAVVVLAITEDDRVVMIRNERFSVGKVLWELPAGTLEAGEDPAVCAARELVEETGYEAAEVRPLCSFFTSPGICTERMYAFEARGLRQVGQKLEEDEAIVVELVERRRVLEMVRSGEIEDGKTIAAVLFGEDGRRQPGPSGRR